MGAVCCRDDAEVRKRERMERSRLVRSKYGAMNSASSPESRFEDGFEEGDMCRRCHVRFSTFTRRHHCRRCKKSFCKNHSSRTASLRSLLEEIGEEGKTGMPSVRVCDSCFNTIRRMQQDRKSAVTLSF